ncbi:ABC-ATPase domain-containing protein [Thermaerobacter litoralis]
MSPTATRTRDDLRQILARIDGRPYPAYKDIAGTYDFGAFTLAIDHVQGDPFAAPSRLRIIIPPSRMPLPDWAATTPLRRTATADWLLRRFHRATGTAAARRGSGKSGLITVDRPGQEILPRTACVVLPQRVEVRFFAGLPAAGRRILGRQAVEMLCQDVPRLVETALLLKPIDHRDLERHVAVAEDQAALRQALAERGLVAFVGDGAILPRESGVSDRPLRGPRVIPFEAPPTLAVELETPHRGKVRGLGIPQGVTLIVGGGYHGKSTLLRALARGVYDHIPGDGRELVVTDPTAVKIRAEDGRRIEQVDISPFIRNLPFDADTRRFSTDEASGSTSQAANIMEALELGARVLLIDEDTSATNFMIRDRRMQALVSKDREPITPFIDRVRALYRDRGVSSILVVGGAGDYLDVADTVIRMDAYRAQDATAEAREVATRFPTGRIAEDPGPFPPVPARVPLPASLDPRRGAKVKIRAHGTDEITFGFEEIDLSAVEQLVDPSQTRAVGAMIRYMTGRHIDGRRSLREALEALYAELDEHGLDRISPFPTPAGDLALPRLFEVGAAINRLRSLRVEVREPVVGGGSGGHTS